MIWTFRPSLPHLTAATDKPPRQHRNSRRRQFLSKLECHEPKALYHDCRTTIDPDCPSSGWRRSRCDLEARELIEPAKSPLGTFETCRGGLRTSVVWEKAEVMSISHFDPKRTFQQISFGSRWKCSVFEITMLAAGS